MPYTIPEYIEVKTATGNTVAFLSPESDGVVAWIDDEQNGSCTIEIELPTANEKWQYLTDKYRIYADGKEFVILNPDAVDKQRDGKKLKGKIKAHESWVLLGKKFPTISNDPQNPSPPWGAVIIVSGGAAHGGLDAGSAGSALSYLLNGTGWTVGTVDVPGTYDLETEKESVLYNINQVQEKWGGILIWDSVDKTVSLRDEATYQPYTGYQIRYAKNLKGINRVDDYDIVTRLYPFGENDLNIANVNGGLLYLDNQSYSTDVLEGVWYNQDLADQTQLKAQAEKQLAVMCRPRHNYKTEVLDLRSLPGYGHETFARSDMVDLLDEDFGANARVRIIRYRHNVFQPWLCDMELGDPLEKIAASVAQTVLMAKFYKNVVAPNTSFQNLLKAIINTEATEINGANGDYTLIDGVSTWTDPDTGDLTRATPKGLIISSDGGQTWKTAISGKGIHADAGWVGKLNAGVVTIGPQTTFAPGYDPTLIDPSASATMGVDSDCLGLWHFDGSLNSHKGVSAIGDESFDTGCFGQAVKVEEGTTNLIVNGNFSNGLTGWQVNQNVTLSVVTENGYNYCKATSNQSTSTPGIKNSGTIAVSPNTTYTVSCIGYSSADCNAKLCAFTEASQTIAVGTDLLPKNAVGKLSLTFTTDATTTSVILCILMTPGVLNAWFKVTDIQLEQKPYATPFVDGTRLGSLKAPTTGLPASQGTISLRAKNLSASANGSVLVDLPKSDNTQGLQAGISSATGHEGEVFISDSDKVFSYFADNCSSTSGWTVGGEGTPASDGNSFYASSYGAGDGLHGPSLTKALELAANDFTCILDVRFVATNGLGNLRISLLDSSNNEVAYIQLIDNWAGHLETQLTAYTGGTLIYDSGPGTIYSDYSGTFKIVRAGSTWTFYAGSTLLGTLNSGVTTQISQVKLLFQQYQTYEVGTMKVNSVDITNIEKQATTAYGPNKSTLTAWDSVSLAWKSDRLSLVVNDTEACYIENPGLPTVFGSNLYIGTDRNGANAINALVDELRIDKVYREVNTRTGWYKTGVPFYTSEDMKQWPGYIRLETDGLKVYDSEGNLRVHVGSWVIDLIRKYGIKIIDGLIEASQIYGTSFQSGAKGASSYIRIGAGFEPLEIRENGKMALNIYSHNGGIIQFHHTGLDEMMGQILYFNDALGTGLKIHARSGSQNKQLLLMGSDVSVNNSGTMFVESDLWVSGAIYSSDKSNIEVTDNYGVRTLFVRESPDHKYIAEGVGFLENGNCIVALDPMFLECIEPNTVGNRWVIQLTPYADTSVFVDKIDKDYFVVQSSSEQSFDFAWSLSAYRKGYADVYLPEYIKKEVN